VEHVLFNNPGEKREPFKIEGFDMSVLLRVVSLNKRHHLSVGGLFWYRRFTPLLYTFSSAFFFSFFFASRRACI